MSKTSHKDDCEDSAKKMKYNIWKKEEIQLTPPQTPTSSTDKYNFNIWNKVESDIIKPIKLSDLKVGVCMKRPLLFRASFKSGKRGSKNGDMFVFHAMDCDNEIQVTVFPQQTTKFFDVIQLNHAYEMVNFNVKKQSENFPIFIGGDVYVSLLANSEIKEVDNHLVPSLRFNFRNIDEIQSLEVNSKCDCIAVIAKNWGQQVVGQNKLKCDLSLTDKSKECIVTTLWGAAYEVDGTGNCVLIHNGVIKEYNGIKTISCSPNTLFWHDPDVADAKDLKSWFDKEMSKTLI